MTQNNLLWHQYFQSKGCELCTQGCNILTAWLPECNLGEKSPTGDLNITRLPHINALFSHDLSARVAGVVSIRHHLNQIKNSHHLWWPQNTEVTRSGCKNVSIHKSSCLAQLWYVSSREYQQYISISIYFDNKSKDHFHSATKRGHRYSLDHSTCQYWIESYWFCGLQSDTKYTTLIISSKLGSW